MIKIAIFTLLLFVQQGMGPGPGTPHAVSTPPTYAGNGCSAFGGGAGLGGGALSCTISSVVVGQTIVCWGSNLNTATQNITDGGGTLTLLSGYPYAWTGANAMSTAYIETSASSGSHVITETFGTRNYGSLICLVASGGSVDTLAKSTQTTTTRTGQSFTTASPNDLVFSFMAFFSAGGANTPGSSPVSLATAYTTTGNPASAYGTVVSPSTTNTVWTSNTTGNGAVNDIVLH